MMFSRADRLSGENKNRTYSDNPVLPTHKGKLVEGRCQLVLCWLHAIVHFPRSNCVLSGKGKDSNLTHG